MQSIFMLWNGEIEPILSSGKNHPELKQLLELSERHYRKLSELLGGEAETLEKYKDALEEYVAISREQAFLSGFSLGQRFFAEALAETERMGELG